MNKLFIGLTPIIKMDDIVEVMSIIILSLQEALQWQPTIPIVCAWTTPSSMLQHARGENIVFRVKTLPPWPNQEHLLLSTYLGKHLETSSSWTQFLSDFMGPFVTKLDHYQRHITIFSRINYYKYPFYIVNKPCMD